MLEQEKFSSTVESYLKVNFPDFLITLEYKEDHSFDCSLESPTKKFSIWIATYDCEITIGLSDPDNISGCHTHYSCYDDDTSEVLAQLSQTINDILKNRLVFYHSSLHGFTWSDDIVRTMIEKQSNEAIEFFTWDGQI